MARPPARPRQLQQPASLPARGGGGHPGGLLHAHGSCSSLPACPGRRRPYWICACLPAPALAVATDCLWKLRPASKSMHKWGRVKGTFHPIKYLKKYKEGRYSKWQYNQVVHVWSSIFPMLMFRMTNLQSVLFRIPFLQFFWILVVHFSWGKRAVLTHDSRALGAAPSILVAGPVSKHAARSLSLLRSLLRTSAKTLILTAFFSSREIAGSRKLSSVLLFNLPSFQTAFGETFPKEWIPMDFLQIIFDANGA